MIGVLARLAFYVAPEPAAMKVLCDMVNDAATARTGKCVQYARTRR